MVKKDRILILGGGISGLACARELKHRGHEVLVVEARERVGGRLKGEPLSVIDHENDTTNDHHQQQQQQQQYPKTKKQIALDMGGALIHGIDANPVYEIVKQMGVPMHATDYCLLLDSNGWPLDPKEDEKISSLFNECLDDTFARIVPTTNQTNTTTSTSSTTTTTGPEPTTATTAAAAKGNFGELFDQVCQERGISPDNPLLKWHRANLELPAGAGFHDLGYTWNDDEPYGFTGDHAAISTSWKYVMEKMAEGLDILYESPISKIQIVLDNPKNNNNNNGNNANHQRSTAVYVPPNTTTTTTTTKESQPQTNGMDGTRIRRVSPRNNTTEQADTTTTSTKEVRRSSRANKGVINIMRILDHTSVCYDDPTKSSKKKKSKVHVTLGNGTVLEANAVVCTLPLGILKLPRGQPGHVQFEPPLPDAKQLSISKLGCGLLNKCAMSFETVFWQDSDFLGLAGTEHSYLVLNAMNYIQPKHPILVFMFGGGFAKEIESWTDAKIVQDCLDVLKKISGKEVPNPIDYCVTRWGQEKYSRMAFTYIPPGVDGGRELTNMSEAIHDPEDPERPLIMFAGEHTTPYHPSTMHGAFLSGVREAYRYDLFLNPGLNDNMEFESTEMIHVHTFPTRRSYRASNNGSNHRTTAQASISSSLNSNGLGGTSSSSSNGVIRSRRRRFAGMSLRKQPKQVQSLQMSAPEQAEKKTPPPTPQHGSRKSQRSISAKKPDLVVSSRTASPPEGTTTTTELAKQKLAAMNALEDRILLRSLQSYGTDTSLVRSKVVPVFGSKRKRKADQIRSRWKQLQASSPGATSSPAWKKWVTKQVTTIPHPDVPSEEGAPQEETSMPERRSKRGRTITPRNIMNY